MKPGSLPITAAHIGINSPHQISPTFIFGGTDTNDQTIRSGSNDISKHIPASSMDTNSPRISILRRDTSEEIRADKQSTPTSFGGRNTSYSSPFDTETLRKEVSILLPDIIRSLLSNRLEKELAKPAILSALSNSISNRLSDVLETKLAQLAETKLFPSIRISADLLFESMAKHQLESIQKFAEQADTLLTQINRYCETGIETIRASQSSSTSTSCNGNSRISQVEMFIETDQFTEALNLLTSIGYMLENRPDAVFSLLSKIPPSQSLLETLSLENIQTLLELLVSLLESASLERDTLAFSWLQEALVALDFSLEPTPTSPTSWNVHIRESKIKLLSLLERLSTTIHNAVPRVLPATNVPERTVRMTLRVLASIQTDLRALLV